MAHEISSVKRRPAAFETVWRDAVSNRVINSTIYKTLFRAFRFGLPDDSPSKRTESCGSSSMGARHCTFSPANHSKHLPRSSDKSGVFNPVMDGQKNSAGGSKLTAQIDMAEPTAISRS